MDVAVIPKRGMSAREAGELEEKLGLPRSHPLHLHLVPASKARRYLIPGEGP